MTSTLDELRVILAAIEARIAAHDAECKRTSGHAVNPDNEIGGMRSRSARAKGRMLDRWDRQAKIARELVAKRDKVKDCIRWVEAAPARDRRDALLLAGWDALAPGDPFPLRRELTVARKSDASVTLESGTRWTREEVTGLRPARVAELRAAMVNGEVLA